MATLYELSEDFVHVMDGGTIIDDETGEVLFEPGDLESLGLEFNEKLESVALFVKNEQSDVDAIKAEEWTLAARRKVKEKRIERLREYMLKCMDATGTSKLDTPRVALSTRKSKRVEVTDETALRQCAPFVFKAQPDKLDKTLLRKIINEGAEVAGAELVENVTLQIK